MNRIVSPLTLGFLLAMTGCPGDDSPPVESDSSSSADTAGTTDPNPGTTTSASESADTTSAGPGSATTDDPGTTTDDPPGTTTDGPPGTTTEEPGSTGEPAMCEPPGDDCGDCVAEQCCDELLACEMDKDCTCFQDCAAMNPGMAGALACANKCGISLPELLNPETIPGALADCTQNACPKCL